MNDLDFKRWLIDRRGFGRETANSRTANCARVCKFEGDLDEHYDRDLCRGLLLRLEYSTSDEQAGMQAAHKIPIAGIIRTGTATFKQAVKLYVQFRNDGAVGGVYKVLKTGNGVPKKFIRRAAEKHLWPEWSQPDEEALLVLAGHLTQHIRFLDPSIVSAIVEDNRKNSEIWRSKLAACGISPDYYLWERSPCTFPGIRRYSGSAEISTFRGHSKAERPVDALRLDDNSFPKQIWSFVFLGRKFANQGPSKYSLAHLVDFKEYKNRLASEYEHVSGEKFPEKLFGLYTSPCNTVYVPAAFLKPTDFDGTIRALIQHRAHQLYGSICNLLPLGLSLRKQTNPEWETSRFNWAEPVGTMSYVKDFLEYRREQMELLFRNRDDC